MILMNFSILELYSQTVENSPSWFISLPLRFTILQDDMTMLSGVQLGKQWGDHWEGALSVYHSFYLQSFKSPANLSGFDSQPRLYINAVGLEVKRHLFRNESNWSGGFQLYSGWGFLKYDLDAFDFESKQVNYFAIEPGIYSHWDVSRKSAVEISFSYRPIFGSQDIQYSSAKGNGVIDVHREFPNGINMGLSWKGYF